MLMKQKTARLQRWLDRLTAACENHKWKSAVAEADCLSAELKQVREELWDQAENEAVPRPAFFRLRSCASFGAKSFGIAIVIICLSTFPIAVESGNPQRVAALATGAESHFEEFALVTTEEKELLQLLRKNLNESNIAIKTAEEKSPGLKKNFTAKAVEKPVVQISAERPTVKQRAENKIKAEYLLTLIQIGEKSLRGSEPAIKIVN